jgi:glycosyltransferase involved in cell wall biosynthesis
MSIAPTVSALVPVHGGVNSHSLHLALKSVLNQTRVPDEIVIVEDGPLRPQQMMEIEQLESRHRTVRIRLHENCGAGVANQAGLTVASGDWIMKVDADDISVPSRLEKQMRTVSSHGADLCGSAMLEFDEDPTAAFALRRRPESSNKIRRRVKWNNPVNHPTSLYRRSFALEVGGYPSWRYMQDYGLFARMIAADAVIVNLGEPLVLFRSGDDLVRRRKASEMWDLERELQTELLRLRLVNRYEASFNCIWRRTYRRLPEKVLRYVNGRILATRFRTDGGR